MHPTLPSYKKIDVEKDLCYQLQKNDFPLAPTPRLPSRSSAFVRKFQFSPFDPSPPPSPLLTSTPDRPNSISAILVDHDRGCFTPQSPLRPLSVFRPGPISGYCAMVTALEKCLTDLEIKNGTEKQVRNDVSASNSNILAPVAIKKSSTEDISSLVDSLNRKAATPVPSSPDNLPNLNDNFSGLLNDYSFDFESAFNGFETCEQEFLNAGSGLNYNFNDADEYFEPTFCHQLNWSYNGYSGIQNVSLDASFCSAPGILTPSTKLSSMSLNNSFNVSKTEKIPKPPNCFILFRRGVFLEVKESLTKTFGRNPTNKELANECARRWKEADMQIREYYVLLADRYAKEHKVNYPNYRATAKRKRKCK